MNPEGQVAADRRNASPFGLRASVIVPNVFIEEAKHDLPNVEK